jgi:protein-tyrosine phosphatase
LIRLKAAMAEAGLEIEIEAAAEYLLDDGFEQKLKNKELMTFGQKHILVELSYYSPHPNLLILHF